jgi:hypothetical protein
VVGTSHPLLRVNNASSPEAALLTYEFALFADSGLNQALSGVKGIAETPGRTAWTVETRLGEDHTYYWRARATDGFSSSPWTSIGWFTVDDRPASEQPGRRLAASGSASRHRQPRLAVTNACDPEGRPLTYEPARRHGRADDDAPAARRVRGIADLLAPPLLLEENATYY